MKIFRSRSVRYSAGGMTFLVLLTLFSYVSIHANNRVIVILAEQWDAMYPLNFEC